MLVINIFAGVYVAIWFIKQVKYITVYHYHDYTTLTKTILLYVRWQLDNHKIRVVRFTFIMFIKMLRIFTIRYIFTYFSLCTTNSLPTNKQIPATPKFNQIWSFVYMQSSSKQLILFSLIRYSRLCLSKLEYWMTIWRQYIRILNTSTFIKYHISIWPTRT